MQLCDENVAVFPSAGRVLPYMLLGKTYQMAVDDGRYTLRLECRDNFGRADLSSTFHDLRKSYAIGDYLGLVDAWFREEVEKIYASGLGSRGIKKAIDKLRNLYGME